mmetsp:Transcript_8931/g.14326  ORF Transcript_8931/g.14326 Transcript_8931/m.14326 type:complete len:229 (+) Transcript_8931:532-1218(+)
MILASRRCQRTIRRDTYGVQVSSVSNEVVAQLAVGQVPDLDEFVPSTTDNQRNTLTGRESNARNPFCVSFRFARDLVFALSKGVPQTNGSIAGSGDNLTIVHRESYTQNILLVSNKATRGFSSGDVPETQFGIPTSRKSKGTVTGNDDIRDEVGMSSQGTTGESVAVFFAAATTVQELPDDDRFITARRQEKVGVFGSRRETGHPVSVSAQSATQSQSFINTAHGRFV